MGIVKGKVYHPTRDRLILWCPACEEVHGISTEPGRWTFDGNYDRPTISPSILCFGSNGETTCHSFVRDGRWEYLNDCRHSLAGRTVEVPDLPGWLTDGFPSEWEKQP